MRHTNLMHKVRSLCSGSMKRIGAGALATIMTVGMLAGSASAASEATATIDTSRSTSLSLYKYDMTGAEENSAWSTSSYVSTGIYDSAVNTALKDYAIQGVEFSYLKIADLAIYKGPSASGQQEVIPLYAFTENTKTNSREVTDFLSALGLTTDDCYRADHDANQNRIWYFKSDTLINALEASLNGNSTITKLLLESYIASNGCTAMPETDENGYSTVSNLNQGLYLLVETRVPENVTSTTDPFLVSLPMTTIDGNEWNYDVTVYPKNETGNPNLEKTVRESKADTGKNDGSSDRITDGYNHTATASDGDVVDYQITSTLPTITSPATYLTTYTFTDTMSKGIQYNGAALANSDVTLEFFTDAECTDPVASWKSTDGKFTVTYSDYDPVKGSSMVIEMTAAGLKEINCGTYSSLYSGSTVNSAIENSLISGYSNCTLRITYSCMINSDATVVYGDSGNPNTVELMWKRTNTDYYDTLKDDCHVYTYCLDLTKEFSDNAGNFDNVKFLVHNTTDGYYVQAALNEAEGIYYVTGHTDKEAAATLFRPMSGSVNTGKVLVRGLEDDTYVITETETDSGYTLLKEDITVVISQTESSSICPVCEKHLLTASATVNGEQVAMNEDNGSVSAIVPLTVINTAGFNLPVTGGWGTWMYGLIGILGIAAAGTIVVLCTRKKKSHA